MTTITHNTDGSITVSTTLHLEGSMMKMENMILDAVNDVGCVATGEALKCFDTDGSPIIKEGTKCYVPLYFRGIASPYFA